MTYSYTAKPPARPVRDPSRSKERKAMDIARRNARRAASARRWGI